MLGVNSRAERGVMQHYISDSIYGLTLAWITSENSTKQLECRHLDSIFFTVAGPSCHAATPLCSGVHCRPPLSVSRRQLLSAPFPNQLSFRVPLPLLDTARFQVQKPFVWFRAKTDKGIVCLAGHPHSVTILIMFKQIYLTKRYDSMKKSLPLLVLVNLGIVVTQYFSPEHQT